MKTKAPTPTPGQQNHHPPEAGQTIDIKKSVVTLGANFWNSANQLGIVDSGAQTKNGPGMPMQTRCARMATHWTVLPRPISSARIPLTPFSYSTWGEKQIQFNIRKWFNCEQTKHSVWNWYFLQMATRSHTLWLLNELFILCRPLRPTPALISCPSSSSEHFF